MCIVCVSSHFLLYHISTLLHSSWVESQFRWVTSKCARHLSYHQQRSKWRKWCLRRGLRMENNHGGHKRSKMTTSKGPWVMNVFIGLIWWTPQLGLITINLLKVCQISSHIFPGGPEPAEQLPLRWMGMLLLTDPLLQVF